MNFNETQKLVLAVLGRGDWIFQALAPHYKSLLDKRIVEKFGIDITEARTFSLMKATALAYGELKDCSLMNLEREPRYISGGNLSLEDRAAITHLIKRIDPIGEIGDFSASHRSLLDSAISLVRDRAPLSVQIIDSYTSNFVKIDGVSFRSASYPRAQGCIFLSEQAFVQSPEKLAISIIHELGHQELFLVNVIDRLVQAELDYNLVHAPFQGRKRPPIGRLHSFYALFRMSQFGRQNNRANDRHEYLLKATLETFQPAELTPFATALLASCSSYLFGAQSWKLDA